MKRGKRRRWLIVLVVVILAAAAATGVLLLLHRGKSAGVHYLTSTAVKGTIAETVQADFTLAAANTASTTIALGGASAASNSSSSSSNSSSASNSSSSSSSSGSTSGVVTNIALSAGTAPHTLQRLLTLSGTPVYAFVSSTPLYENLSVSLSSGTDATNVKALQLALKKAGYYSGSIDGDFGTGTRTALESWQADQNLSQTGQIATSQFVWVPAGAVIESWNVSLGSAVSGGTGLATVDFPRDLIAEALVAQADISSLKIGQKAALTIDGATSDPFTATISSIANQPASSNASGGGSSSTVEYTVDLAPRSLPTLAKSGMTGSLTVTIASRGNVLLVPTSAVSSSSSSTFVRVMMNGTPTYRQVSTGMATSSLTQITSGLAAGEVVVTGQYTNSATNGTTTGGGFTFPGLGGGSFRRATNGGGQ
jgi:peptidoglycan hydrolase-like protein with peptidoglycan-binding domain